MPFTSFPIGQYTSGETFLHRLDPRSKIIFLLVYIVMLFEANTLTHLAVFGGFVFLTVRLSGLPVSYFWHGFKGTFLLITLCGLLQLVFVHSGKLLWAWGWIEIYDVGLMNAVFLTCRFVLLILMASFLTLSTPPALLTYGLQSLLRPFNRLGFPSHELALMMMVAVRYIPAFLQELDKKTMALKARGADFESRNFMQRFKTLLRVVVPMFIFSLRRSHELALAMESRCYKMGKARTNRKMLHAGWRDATIGIAAMILVIVTIFFRQWK